MFGEPETDNIGYGLDCADGRLSFSASASGPPKDVQGVTFPTHLGLSAGGRTFDLPATGSIADMGDGETIITARPDNAAAVFRALLAGRHLTTETYDGRGSAVCRRHCAPACSSSATWPSEPPTTRAAR